MHLRESTEMSAGQRAKALYIAVERRQTAQRRPSTRDGDKGSVEPIISGICVPTGDPTCAIVGRYGAIHPIGHGDDCM